MYKKVLFSLATLLFLWLEAKAQVTPPCPNPPPAGGTSCNSTCVYCDFNGYSGTSGGTASTSNVICGQIVVHNDQWLGFIANSPSMTVEVITSNCVLGDGVQLAFFDACNATNALICNPGIEDGEGIPLSLTYNNFVPGQTYYLMIDGSFGDVCDFTVSITSGSVTPPEPGIPQQPSGPTALCPGATAIYTIPPVDGAGWYRWTAPAGARINGQNTNNLQVAAPQGTTVTITFGNTAVPNGNVCVAAGNACYAPNQACLPISITAIPLTVKPPITLCYEDRVYTWTEAPFSTITYAPGTHTLNSTYDSYLGCDSMVRQVITVLPQNTRSLGIKYICPGSCFVLNGISYCNQGPQSQQRLYANTCDTLLTFNIVVIPAVANIPAVPQINCSNPNLTLTSSGSTAISGTTTYRWTNASWTTIGSAATQNVSGTGTYHLIVSTTLSGNTCRDTASVTVSSTAAFPGATASGGVITCTSPNVTLQSSSTTPGVNYLWTGPGITPANQAQQNPVVGVAGTYSVSVINPGNGCSSTAIAIVTPNDTLPTATATGGTISCSQPSVTLDGGSNIPNATYTWSGPGINAGNQNQENPTVLTPGAYSLTVVNPANGCSRTATATVIPNSSLPVAGAGADQNITCQQLSVTLNGTASGSGPLQYLWTGPGITPANQNQLTPTVTMGGTYTLNVLDTSNGCSATDVVQITELVSLPTANAGTDGVLNCGILSVILNGAASSQGANFTAQWSGPGINAGNQNVYSPQVTLQGTYTLTITNTVSQCTATDNVVVTLNNAAPTVSAGNDQILTCSSTNGINLNGSGGPAGVTFLWTGPGINAGNETQQSPNVNVQGTYTLQVTNPANQCTATDQVLISQDANAPIASAGADQVINCTISSVTLGSSATSSGAGIQYLWTGPGITGANQNQLMPVVTDGGTYTLTVNNTNNGCSSTDVVLIMEQVALPTALAGADSTLNCAVLNITLNSSGSSQGANFTAIWTGPSINAGNQGSYNPQVSLPGTYTLTITDITNNCTATDQVIISQNNTLPTVSAGNDQTLTCNTLNGITLNGSGGPAGVTFIWTGPGITAGNATQATPNVSDPGTYTLQVSNPTNQCTATDQVVITQDTIAPVASAGADQVINCTVASVTLGSSATSSGAGIEYLWTGPGITGANQNQVMPVVTMGGTYNLTVNNTNNGCSASDMTLITEEVDLPTALAGADSTLNCAVLNITLNGSGSSQGANFTAGWTGPSINAGNQGSYNPQVNLPGTYTLTITNTTNNCSATDQVIISQNNTLPTVSAGNDLILTCTTPNGITLNGSGSPATITYLWNGPGINAGNATVANPLVNDPGTYNLIVTNTVNQCSATDQVEVTEDSGVAMADAGADLTLTCSVTSVNIDASASTTGAGIEYLWTGPGIAGANATAQNPQGITLPGTYNLTVTNIGNSCSNTDVVVIAIDTIRPLSSAGADLTLNCYNGNSDTLDASASTTGADFTLVWTGPAITPANQNLIKPVVNQAGTYVVLITNTINNCTASADALVTSDTLSPIADAGADGIIDCANSTASIGGNSSSGADFEYLWTGPDINTANEALATLSIGQAGPYTLVVTDVSNGCTAANDVLVNEDLVYPVANAGADTVITCENPVITLNGAASASGTGIQILWSGLSITPASQGLTTPDVTQPDNYVLTVTNTINSCVSIDTVVVLEDIEPPVALAGTDAILDCETTSTILDGSGSSVGLAIAYLWAGPGVTAATETMQSLSVSDPGTYTLLVTNTDNGCEAQDEVLIDQDITLPIAEAGADLLLDCQQPTQAIDGSGSSTGANIQYAWQGADINAGNMNVISPMVSDSGTYIVVVTNIQNHCSATDMVYVGLNADRPATSAGTDGILNCSVDTLQLDGTLSETGVNIEYAWSGPGIVSGESTLNSPNIFQPGTYTITVTNTANGCSDTDVVTVSQDTIAPLVLAGNDQTLTCANSTTGVTLSSAGSSSGAGFSIQWSGSGITPVNETLASPVVTGVGPYVLTILNTNNGCTATDVVVVLQDQDAPVSVAGADQTITCTTTQVSLDGSGSSSPSGSLEYLWAGPGVTSGSQNNAVITVNQSGNYSLTIVNPVSGCQAVDNVLVNLDTAPPVATAAGDTITCQSLTGTLSATSSEAGSLFAWSGPGINTGNATLPTLQVNQPGAYSVTVTAANGCTDVALTVMNVDSNFPVGTAEGVELNCINNGMGSISGSVTTPGATFSWSGPNGFSATTATVTISVAGQYTFNIVANNGCVNPIPVVVSSNFTAPVISASVPGNLDCSTTSLTINGTGTSTGNSFTYAWTTAGGNILSGDDSLSPVVDAPGAYTLLVTNMLNGCTSTETVTVANDPNIPTSLDLTVRNIRCFGDKNGVIAISGVNGGTEPFFFSLNGETESTVDQYSNLAAGEYSITLEDANGCVLDTVISINEPAELLAELGPDMDVHLGDSVTINAQIMNETPIADVKWNFSPNRDSADCCSFSYRPLQTYRHEVTVRDSNGCVARDVVMVTVRKERQVFIPNIIDLTSDNPLNALLMIHGGTDVVKVHKWLIFDRWGNSVYEARNFLPNDPAYTWNGTVRGDKGQPAVFVWMAEIEFLDGQTELFEGDVTIVR
ncbi:MAG: hypothetical protein IPL27_26825 [Lewinellaceae bacterium]|nr:hypothetical protein [Lewinellaceae bacterium]